MMNIEKKKLQMLDNDYNQKIFIWYFSLSMLKGLINESILFYEKIVDLSV